MHVVKNSAKLPRRWQRDKSVLKSCTGATTRACAMKNKRNQRHLFCKLLLLLLLHKINYCLDTVVVPFPDTFKLLSAFYKMENLMMVSVSRNM